VSARPKPCRDQRTVEDVMRSWPNMIFRLAAVPTDLSWNWGLLPICGAWSFISFLSGEWNWFWGDCWPFAHRGQFQACH